MNNKKGFTLVEMLIVVAIIAILVGIAIPVMNSKLEVSREATDLANVRAAYAEVMMAAISDNQSAVSSMTGEKIYKIDSYSISVPLEQKESGWQTEGDIQIGSCVRSHGYPEWVGDPGDVCTIKYSKETVSLKWGVDVPAALISLWDNKTLNKDNKYKDFSDVWSSASSENGNHPEDLRNAKKVSDALKKLGVNVEDATFEANWGTIYDETWTYAINPDEKITVRPNGTKYLIVTLDGEVSADDAGKTVNAVAIDVNGNKILGTVEVSTNYHSRFEGRTSVALINFKPY